MARPIIVIDTEWGFRDGRIDCETSFEPVVLCAQIMKGDSFTFWGRDHRLFDFVHAHQDHLWVAHNAVAEMKYMLRLGIQPPPFWFDTHTAFRFLSNRPGYIRSKLADMLTILGLAHFIPPEKAAMQQKILHLQHAQDDPAVAAYCMADVTATTAAFTEICGKQGNGLNERVMDYWAEFLKVVAKIEITGVPVDIATYAKIWRHQGHIAAALRQQVNATATVYRRNGSFNGAAFFAWVEREGIRWPRKWGASGWYSPLDDDTLKAMSGRHKFIELVKDTRKSLDHLKNQNLLIDALSRRHYFAHLPFWTTTGRNQLKQCIFSAPKWMRWLIVPPSPEHILLYVDFSAQEIGIAASLSGDAAMAGMYAAGDPHMTAAITAGAAPPGATKDTHEAVRKQFKTVNLGTLYSQTEWGISEQLGVTPYEAKCMLDDHRRIYCDYHTWSERVVATAYHNRGLSTSTGWKVRIDPEHSTKWRTFSNWPIQATGAEVMRVMTVALDRLDVTMHAIVHDGWLLSCHKSEEARVRVAIEKARQFACEKVLKGFPLKLDITRFDGRYREDDKKAQEFWEFILANLPMEDLYVPDREF